MSACHPEAKSRFSGTESKHLRLLLRREHDIARTIDNSILPGKDTRQMELLR